MRQLAWIGLLVLSLAATGLVEGLPLEGDTEVTVLLDDTPGPKVDPREEKLLQKAKMVSKMPSGAEKEDKKAEVLVAAKKLEQVQKKESMKAEANTKNAE